MCLRTGAKRSQAQDIAYHHKTRAGTSVLHGICCLHMLLYSTTARGARPKQIFFKITKSAKTTQSRRFLKIPKSDVPVGPRWQERPNFKSGQICRPSES